MVMFDEDVFTPYSSLSGISVLMASIIFATGRIRAAKNLHLDMLSNILRSPLHFFDSTPMGRITNRFSKDIDMIDTIIPWTLSAWIQTTLISLSTITVISINTPLFLIVLVPLAIFYFIMQVGDKNNLEFKTFLNYLSLLVKCTSALTLKFHLCCLIRAHS